VDSDLKKVDFAIIITIFDFILRETIKWLHCKKVLIMDVIEKSTMVSFSGGHKLFDEVNKPPCAPGMNKN